MSHWFDCPKCGEPAARGPHGVPEPCPCGSGELRVRIFRWPRYAVLQKLVDRRDNTRLLPRIFYCPIGRLIEIGLWKMSRPMP